MRFLTPLSFISISKLTFYFYPELFSGILRQKLTVPSLPDTTPETMKNHEKTPLPRIRLDLYARPGIRGRSKQRTAKPDSMIYNGLYNVCKQKYKGLHRHI